MLAPLVIDIFDDLRNAAMHDEAELIDRVCRDGTVMFDAMDRVC